MTPKDVDSARIAVSPSGGSVWSSRQLIDSPQLFERFPYGLVLVARQGSRVINLNRKARDLLLSDHHPSAGPDWTCCELVCRRIGPILGGGCMADRAVDAGVLLPEVRIDFDAAHAAAAWVTASALDSEGAEVLFHLRPGSTDDRRRRNVPRVDDDDSPRKSPVLQITTLGRFRVEGEDGPLDGEWLEQRPGQFLKYLVCERRRLVPNDQIAEALWPDAGPREARSRARYQAHVLREKLEPERRKRAPGHFVVARRGGYLLDIKHARVDADEFEREVRAGLTAILQQGAQAAVPHLESALRIYRDDFLPEDPYAEWALVERDRLRDLAAEAVRALVHAQIGSGQLDAAAPYARRLAEMEPFDSDVQRILIELCLRRGRRSEAVRRYGVLRQRMMRSFGEEPDFDLSEIAG